MGKEPGVYREWTAVQEQIEGVKGPKYKKFTSLDEAEEFVRMGGRKGATAKKDGPSKTKKEVIQVVDEPTAKKVKVSSSGATKGRGKLVRVWTDGSSLSNGRSGARAGVGVYFGPGDSRYILRLLSFIVPANKLIGMCQNVSKENPRLTIELN